MPNVSHSEVETYLSCRRKHYYSYGLNLTPRKTGDALAYGSAGHKVLESFYGTIIEIGGTKNRKQQRLAFDSALAVAQATYDEIVAGGFEAGDKQMDLGRMLFGYYFPNEPFVRQGWLIEAVEQDQTLLIEGDLSFRFIIDMVAIDPEGKRVVIDHKFSGRFIDSNDTVLKPQAAKYLGALRGKGIQTSYLAYNQIKPTRIVGTRTKEFPEGKGPTLEQAWSLVFAKPNNVQVVNTFTEQIGVSNEILAIKEQSLEDWEAGAWRAFNSMTCGFCQFRDLCESQLIGANSALLMRADFEQKKKPREVVTVEED